MGDELGAVVRANVVRHAACEEQVAERLRALADGTPPWPDIDAEKAVAWAEGKLGVTLAASQREAVAVAVSSNIIVITGGPGVGKEWLR